MSGFYYTRPTSRSIRTTGDSPIRCTTSEDCARLGDLATLTKDPPRVIDLTRLGKPKAALVSMIEVKRIGHFQDGGRLGRKYLLSTLHRQ